MWMEATLKNVENKYLSDVDRGGYEENNSR